MLLTAEVRWFVPGAVPPDVMAWFVGNRAIQPHVREDRYLLFPSCDTLGVKVREGRLEVKARRGPAAPLEVVPGITGSVERWLKWIWAGRDLDAAMLVDAQAWVSVRKERWQRYYGASAPGLVEVAAASPASGCKVEVTVLALQGRPWWTVAFEADDTGGHELATLLETVTVLLRDGAPVLTHLTPEGSLSYPGWLNTHLTASA